MSEAPESREAQPEITINELEQYIQKSIRPSVIPSTFRVVEMEFGRLAEENTDARILLEQMMLFFRNSHRVVYEKLMDLYGGLYMPPIPQSAAPKKANMPEVNSLDWDDAGDDAAKIAATAAATAKARAELPTLTEKDLLETIYSMPTIIPPGSPQTGQSAQPIQPAPPVQESVVREKPRQEIRRETPTIPDFEKTAELAEQIRAEILFLGANAEDLPVPAPQQEDEDSDPGFHDRVTLVEAPSPELIKKSSYPPPPGEDDSAEAGVSGQTPEESGTTAIDEVFSGAEEKWFKEAEEAEER